MTFIPFSLGFSSILLLPQSQSQLACLLNLDSHHDSHIRIDMTQIVSFIRLQLHSAHLTLALRAPPEAIASTIASRILFR